jgi:hypothetical protein
MIRHTISSRNTSPNLDPSVSAMVLSAILKIYPLSGVPYSGWTKEEAPAINPGP